MNKICTSIEQSQKLIELGIDVNTADMYWSLVNKNHPPIIGKYCAEYGGMQLPAWSLTALSKLIKSEIYGETIYGDTIIYKVDFRKYKLTDDVDLYQIAYGNIKFDEDGHDSFKDMINTGQKEDPVDAAFEMVDWLLLNGYIKKGE